MSERPPAYESRRTGDTATIGALLRALATDLERETTVRFESDGEVVAVDAPETLTLELEVEPGETGVELEFELSWDGDADEAVSTAVDADEEGDPWEAPEPATVEEAPSKATFELYRDRADEWRWRLRHDNGNIIADGGEGYASISGARNGIRSVMANAPGADVERL